VKMSQMCWGRCAGVPIVSETLETACNHPKQVQDTRDGVKTF
jgi:hypothetical protein